MNLTASANTRSKECRKADAAIGAAEQTADEVKWVGK
jgi:hypothetical protein